MGRGKEGEGYNGVYSAKSHDIRENVMLRARRTVRIVFAMVWNELHYIRQGTKHFPTGFSFPQCPLPLRTFHAFVNKGI